MKKKITSILLAITISIFATSSLANAIYSWKDKNGTTVFSSTKPTNSKIKYKTMDIGQPTIVKAPKVNKIEEQDNSKYAKALSQERSQQTQQQELSKQQAQQRGSSRAVNITITQPSNGEGVFNHAPIIAIKTNPALTAQDKPVFKINGAEMSAKFDEQENSWVIPRPEPGENSVLIAGMTSTGDPIVMVKPSIFYLHNGWLAESQNDKKSNPLYSNI